MPPREEAGNTKPRHDRGFVQRTTLWGKGRRQWPSRTVMAPDGWKSKASSSPDTVTLT